MTGLKGNGMQVQVTGITKRYGKKEVLKGAGFEASSGECIGIVGKNGSGKSTLLSILAGVLKPDTGVFLTDGQDVIINSELRHQNVAYVPQGTPLIGELSARDNLRMWYSAEELRTGLESGFLKVLGIDEFIDVPVNNMSGGMKKRLSIGCAINNNPKVLLLDEPSAALDLICREEIYAYFKAFLQSGGILILVTHELREIAMCDKCFLMKEGILVPYTYDENVSRLIELL